MIELNLVVDWIWENEGEGEICKDFLTWKWGQIEIINKRNLVIQGEILSYTTHSPLLSHSCLCAVFRHLRMRMSFFFIFMNKSSTAPLQATVLAWPPSQPHWTQRVTLKSHFLLLV